MLLISQQRHSLFHFCHVSISKETLHETSNHLVSDSREHYISALFAVLSPPPTSHIEPVLQAKLKFCPSEFLHKRAQGLVCAFLSDDSHRNERSRNQSSHLYCSSSVFSAFTRHTLIPTAISGIYLVFAQKTLKWIKVVF